MQEKKPPISEWAKDDQPREKLLRKNPASLSDSELLAILIRTGSDRGNAVELARSVLELGKNDVTNLGRLTINELTKIRGIGKVKAITIAAALELGRRRQAVLPSARHTIKNSREVADFFQARLRDHAHEVFGVLFLNRSGRVMHFDLISQGGITATVVDTRLIIKQALSEDALSIILCHNHPSGNLKPSKADEELTSKIRQAAGLFDIRLLDHIIVSEEGYFSFADEGLL